MFQAGKAVSAPGVQGADHYWDWMETAALYWCSYSLYKYDNNFFGKEAVPDWFNNLVKSNFFVFLD